MPRVTIDEASRMVDQFTDFVETLIGEDVVFKRAPGIFSVEVLRQQARTRITVGDVVSETASVHDIFEYGT